METGAWVSGVEEYGIDVMTPAVIARPDWSPS